MGAGGPPKTRRYSRDGQSLIAMKTLVVVAIIGAFGAGMSIGRLTGVGKVARMQAGINELVAADARLKASDAELNKRAEGLQAAASELLVNAGRALVALKRADIVMSQQSRIIASCKNGVEHGDPAGVTH